MSKLPILEKNAYLSVLVKDNGIFAHLGYTDYNANRSYILSDFTDLTPLKKRLDDEFFNKSFWYEYFDNLEKVFNWDIVKRDGFDLFSFKEFNKEGDGVCGIRVMIDDNQKYFNKMFSSLRNFSQDISLRVLDDNTLRILLDDMADRLGYEDLMLVDMDLKNFSVYRSTLINDKNNPLKRYFQKSKINWDNEYGVIDSLNDSRIRAFLSTDLTKSELLNRWSNFVLNTKQYVEDPNLLDILRAYSTIQLYSMFQNDEKISLDFGNQDGKSAMIITGTLPSLLEKKTTMLSIIDGLELNGSFDCYWNLDNKIYTYGRSYIESPKSSDIILGKTDIFSSVTKVLIPDVKRQKNPNKLIMSGYIDSLDLGKSEFYALSPDFSFVKLPISEEKLIFEAKLKNGTRLTSIRGDQVSFISSHGGVLYDSVLVDGRTRPIVYGPDIHANRIKLQMWLNDN